MLRRVLANPCVATHQPICTPTAPSVTNPAAVPTAPMAAAPAFSADAGYSLLAQLMFQLLAQSGFFGPMVQLHSLNRRRQLGSALTAGRRRAQQSRLCSRRAAGSASGFNTAPAMRVAKGSVPRYSQGRYRTQLGFGRSTIARTGCALTALAATASRMHGRKIDPVRANELCKRGGAFRRGSSNLHMVRGARALGLVQDGRHVLGKSSRSQLAAIKKKFDRSLDQGRPGIAAVDYTRGRSSDFSEADHFITICGRSADGKTYYAVDPAGGRRIALKLGADGWLRGKGACGRYRVTELIFHKKR